MYPCTGRFGCVGDDHLELEEMVEDKAAVGRKALGVGLRRCR